MDSSRVAVAALPEVLSGEWWASMTTQEENHPHRGKAWFGWGSVADLAREVESFCRTWSASVKYAPPSVAELAPRLPKPSIEVAALPEVLARICTAAPFDRLLHAGGRDLLDLLRNVHGDVRVPDLVAYPREEADVQALLAWCQSENVAVVPFGGGSSVVQGVMPPEDRRCITLDTAYLDAVNVDEISCTAMVGAGVYGPALEARLRVEGLTLRYYPQSFEYSTVGGWLATRGGGHFATGETHIDDMVQSLRIVTPVGISEMRGTPSSGAGPSEHRLYLGSEGALGVITSAQLKLRPRPAVRVAKTLVFLNLHSATQACRRIMLFGLRPANLRCIDALEFVRSTGLAIQGGAVLLVAFEGPAGMDDVCAAQLTMAVRAAAEEGGQPLEDTSSGKKWGSGFMRGGYMLTAATMCGLLLNTFETCVTWTQWPTLHQQVQAAVQASAQEMCGDLAVMTTCRITHVYSDGLAPYYTILVDTRDQERDDRMEIWAAIKVAVSKAILEAGGTATHHHAVGRLHAASFAEECGALFPTIFSAVKRALDPRGVMNPGVVLARL